MIDLNIIRKQDRYKGFIYFKKPVKFDEYFKNQTFDLVQLHDIDIAPCGSFIGFCGSFSWQNNTIKPLDGDSYTPNMNIFGFREFAYDDHDEEMSGLDILTDSW